MKRLRPKNAVVMVASLLTVLGVVLLLPHVAVGNGGPVSRSWTPTADTILYNGKIITVDDKFSIVDSVAIKDGRFIAVGTRGEVMRYAGNDTKKINLKRYTVIPGLIDSHNHMFNVGMDMPKTQLVYCKTIADVLATIRSAAETLGPGEWVVTSSGWHEGMLAEHRLPTRTELDAAAPNNPVFVPRGGHVAVVNSLALQLAGVTKDTPDPAGGEFKRDPGTGELTGMVVDTAKNYFTALLPVPTYAEKVNQLQAVMARFNREGITGVIEPGLVVGSDELRAYMELWSKQQITVRTGVMIWAHSPQDVLSNPFYQGFGDEFLRISGIKMMMDGGVETAWLKDPYLIVPGEQEDPDYHGISMWDPALFEETCAAAATRGWHVETHAVGDQAIQTVVDAYAKVNETTPIGDLRWTVMHIFLPTQEAIDKMKQIGIYATVQDHPTFLGMNQVRYWGQERAAYAIPIRKLIDDGIHLGGGTDAPVIPFESPFLSMDWMVTRETLSAGVLGPEQGITRKEALELYTRGSAQFTFEENTKGSIEPNKLADLVILDRDYLTIPASQISDIKPVATMVGGEFVYRAVGW